MQKLIINKENWLLLSISVVVLLCVMFDASYAGELTVEPANSTVNNEVSALARGWMSALVKRDFETLAALSIPEYRAGIRNGLSNRGSKLHKALYLAKTSPYRKFENNPNFGVTVLGHKDLQNLGQGTTACFFDRHNPPTWPSDSALLPAVEKRSDVYCIFLIRSNERWEVSTDFLER